MSKDVRQTLSILVGALSIAGLAFIFASYQEARSFNRLTGSSATTWDAIWVELRVVEPSRAPLPPPTSDASAPRERGWIAREGIR